MQQMSNNKQNLKCNPQISLRGAPDAPATQNDAEMLRALHLPRKIKLRSSKCCTAPATQKQPAPIVLNRRQTSAELSGGAPSAAPATPNETEVLQVLHLPSKSSRSTQSSPDFRGPSGSAPSAAPATQNETEVLK